MNVDFETIDLAAIKPNSLVVLRAPIDALTVPGGMEQIAATLKRTRPSIDPSVHFIVMPDDMKIEEIDEAVMNQAGWYRFSLGVDLANGPDTKATDSCKPTE